MTKTSRWAPQRLGVARAFYNTYVVEDHLSPENPPSHALPFAAKISSAESLSHSLSLWGARTRCRPNSKNFHFPRSLPAKFCYFPFLPLTCPFSQRPPPAAVSSSETLTPSRQNTAPEGEMDISDIARKLGLSDSKHLIRKAEELRRLSDVHFDSSIIGVGEVCKAIICLEIAATRLQVLLDRQSAIKLSGMSEKAYNRSFNALQNGIGLKATLDIRELGIQFGCVRLIPFVQKGLSLYKDRFLAALPAPRRASADFSRPVFTATAFYLCAKRHKLKVDKIKLIELCGTSESEFTSVSTSMKDLCFDVFGITKEKKDPKAVKGHRELLDALPGKRKYEDDGDVSEDSIDDEDGLELPSYKRHKRMEKLAYQDWKSSVIASNHHTKAKVPDKRKRQARINFIRKVPETVVTGFVRG